MSEDPTNTTPATPVSYEVSIKPLFRVKDRNAMINSFDLWNYDDVKDNAQDIYDHVASGHMPCDGRWPEESVALFKEWMDTGMNP